MKSNYKRFTQTSVTNFLYCGDYYLFLKRRLNKQIDPGKLNGIGGRLEIGEDYLAAAIRETKEEAGYRVDSSNVQLSGIVKLEGGYDEDWVMCFFKIKVPSKNLPLGKAIGDGELIWIHKDKVLDSQYQLVDDITYCFKDIVEGKYIFFITAKLYNNQKVSSINVSKISR